MENPATWGAAERIINKVLEERLANVGVPGFRAYNLSLERQIAEELREAGLLLSEEQRS